ncbi:sigma-70 family RNA polymerase sigma factor [Paenibacillus dendritiformis]|uniref:sigma-70 family RNA polymerase sigma factor n=1 Tax=Paenibacillus dendritiformis TaxID=130049 RepID=UPI00365209F1
MSISTERECMAQEAIILRQGTAHLIMAIAPYSLALPARTIIEWRRLEGNMETKGDHSTRSRPDNPVEELYASCRGLAFSIAYRMLGAVSDAEDVVQDVFADMAGRDLSEVRNRKAYIAKWVTNRCLNILQSARRTREAYPGEWLPEPLAASGEQPDQLAERADSLSYAYLVMLERLTPVERAVLLLREAFEYDYEEIADIVGKSVPNCRKILSRAKEHARAPSPSAPAGEAATRRSALVARFMSAFQHYDVEALLELLAEDAVLITDGGPHVRAAMRPLTGQSRVMKLLSSRKTFAAMRHSPPIITDVNGEPNAVYLDQGAVRAVCCFMLTPDQERILQVYIILNPDKLDHLARKQGS